MLERVIGEYSGEGGNLLVTWCPKCESTLENETPKSISEWYEEDRRGNEYPYIMFEDTNITCSVCGTEFIAQADHERQAEIWLEIACGD